MAAAKKKSKKKTPTRKTPTKKKTAASPPAPSGTTRKKTKTTAAKKSTPKKKTVATKKAPSVKKTTKTRSKKTEPAAKPAPSPTKKTPAPRKPKKPSFDAAFLTQIRELLLDDRASLLSMMQSAQQQLAGRDTGLADLSDIASGGFEDELAIGLMASEAATLEKIDSAIKRINDGTYGMCVDCEKPIPKKRLEFLPYAQRCMECEGNRERRVRLGTAND